MAVNQMQRNVRFSQVAKTEGSLSRQMQQHIESTEPLQVDFMLTQQAVMRETQTRVLIGMGLQNAFTL